MSDDFQKNFFKLQCPFTWLMDDIDSSISIDYKSHDEEEELLLLKLMRIIMTVYVQTNEKVDGEIILKNLKECENIVVKMILENDFDKLDFSIDAVNHVVQATSCHVFWKIDNKERAKALFKKIKSFESMDEIERSTINACRSIGWSKYHRLGSEEAVNFIRLALKESPNCGLWHFILGKNLRRMRRDLSIGAVPSDEERGAFLKAHEKSPNTVFQLFVAQMYRESKYNQQATNMYQQILDSRPKSRTINLRLALGFIRLFKLHLAKRCLDRVAAECQDDSMYLHYTGIYYMKKKEFTLASQYLKRAADDKDSFPAWGQYIRCMLRLNPSYDPTEFLLSKIEKFKNLPEKQIQCLVIDTAFNFLRKRDIKKTLYYFLLAIEIDPKSLALQEHYSCFEPGKSQDIYQVLAKEVFLLAQEKRASLDETALETFDDLKNYYDEYQEERTQSIVKALSEVRT